jgi:type I restriction enzyme, S subunit
MRPGDVLISRMADPIGRACIVPRLPFRTVTAVDVSILRVDESVADRRFITHLCNSRLVRNQVDKVARGTTRSRITRIELGEIRIPLPGVFEQHRIAGQLEEAGHLRRIRRHALELSDAFMHAAFLELFGDPVRNTKGWDVERLEDVCASKGGIKAGPFGSSLKKEAYSKSGIRIYGQEQVIAGDFSIGDYYISLEMFEKFRSYEVRPGDLLLSLVGTFGKAVVVPEIIERGIINPRLLKISPLRDQLDSVFLAQLIQHPIVQASLERMSHGGTMGILNAGLLKEVRVIVPPLSLQRQFTALRTRHMRLRALQRESLRQTEHFFQTLRLAAVR